MGDASSKGTLPLKRLDALLERGTRDFPASTDLLLFSLSATMARFDGALYVALDLSELAGAASAWLQDGSSR